MFKRHFAVEERKLIMISFELLRKLEKIYNKNMKWKGKK